jgi:hypothetical protein
MSTSDVLDAKIRALVIELVESAPPAPTPSTIDSKQWDAQRPRRKPARTRRFVVAAPVGVVVAVAAVLLAFLLPSVGQRTPAAAAAQLRLIAANASNQPALTVGRDQWLEVTSQSTNSIALTMVGSTPVTGATASISSTSTQWSNNFGETCWTTTFGSVQFASASNQTAWTSAGLSTSPAQPTASNCLYNPDADASNGGGFAYGGGITDVSSLPTDPSTLARELTTGSTGIAGIDHLPNLDGQNPGFARVVALLVDPLSGASPALHAAIFKALALMPGVRALGETTTHTGATGLGFDAPTNSPASNIAIVVDPNTGTLLEARNIELLAPDFLSPFKTAAFPASQSWGGQFVVQWIDPSNQAQVVDTTSLPSEVHPAPPPTALFTAIVKPGSSTAEVSALEQQIIQQFGRNAFSTFGDEEAQSGTPETMNFTFVGSPSQVQAVAAALRGSPIVGSVTVDDGDN